MEETEEGVGTVRSPHAGPLGYARVLSTAPS
ncbi:hypothetical protein HD595_002060 [Nonomuraea roseoviolacea subsp. carminata]|uniref:Uncharacterized protein n=1 Tax=Nonomuraea roseoviolacea subsp. carminata TaxID=160689 RepID=A0ABT1JVZ2_9ACTN|nr:hypothetical protein [Nonomuraea roseoviolacea subsp. carminata]